MAYLSYIDSNGSACRVDLTRKVAIGRHPAQDIQLLDRVVSKEHAVLEYTGENYIIIDVGSRNGTFLNGQQLPASAEHSLNEGDSITIGATKFTFRSSTAEESLIQKVTFHEQMDSAIRTRVSGTFERGFLPEAQLTDIAMLRQDYEKLRIANELSFALSREFDLERLLHKILDRAFSIFRCDRGVILIQQDDSENLVPRAAKLRSNTDAVDNIRISETILREVIDTHQGILSSDAMMDSRFSGSHSIILEGIRSTMSVPLLYRDSLKGIIHLDSQIATGVFGEKDLQLLTGFARQAAVAISHSQLVQRMNQEALAREKLGRLLPPNIVEEVVSGRMDIRKGGNLVEATVMFADIRGFTSMSEAQPPQDIVTMLNEYFEIMVDIIFKWHGTLDKFVGDEIMAIWGAPFPHEEDTVRAVSAAVEMQRALKEFNDTRLQDGLGEIHAGVGLNTGEMVAGYMGSTRSMSYTVVGDPVNVASRVCSLCKAGNVLITAQTLNLLRGLATVDVLPPARVKGKSEALEIYRVLDMATLQSFDD